jgi:phage terminase small subunit
MADGTIDNRLTLKQAQFIAAYLGEANGNATEAARIAGYTHPNVQGPRLLGNVCIAARVRDKVSEIAASPDDVLRELASVAFAPWHDFVEVTGRAKDGHPTKARSDIASKVKALEILAKHHQLLVDRQIIDMNVREHRVGVPQSTLDSMFRTADRPDA